MKMRVDEGLRGSPTRGLARVEGRMEGLGEVYLPHHANVVHLTSAGIFGKEYYPDTDGNIALPLPLAAL